MVLTSLETGILKDLWESYDNDLLSLKPPVGLAAFCCSMKAFKSSSNMVFGSKGDEI